MKATRRWAPPRFKLCLLRVHFCHVMCKPLSHYPQRLITLPAHVHNTRVALSLVRRRGSRPCLRPIFPSNQPHAHHHCITSHRHQLKPPWRGNDSSSSSRSRLTHHHHPPLPGPTPNLDLGQLLRISPYPFSFSLRPLPPPAPSPRRPSSPLLSLITNKKKKKPRHKEQKQEKPWDATTRTTPASPTARYD